MTEFAQPQKQTRTSGVVRAIKPTESTFEPAQVRDPALARQAGLSNQAVQRLLRWRGVQAKLTVGAPDDVYEREADRVAEQVLRMPDPRVQRQAEPEEEEEEEEELIQPKPMVEQITPLIQRQVDPEEEEEEEELIQPNVAGGVGLQRQMEAEDEEEDLVQATQTSGQTRQVAPAFGSEIDALRSGGQSLSGAEREFFEPRFGYDFSQVRVHTDSRASSLAREINARAFTRGRDIVFGAGRHPRGTRGDRRLLAHELAHVVQQGAGRRRRDQGQAATDFSGSRGSVREKPGSSQIQRKDGKNKRAKTAGKQIIIIANGYKGYDSEAKEIEHLDRRIWFPSTPDFSATAYHTQRKDVYGASTADQFFGALQAVKGKIRRVAFIGHGNTSGLGLSGRPLSWFDTGLMQSDVTRWQASIDSKIKPKLSRTATLDLYACNVAAGKTFAKSLAKSLGICVRGFPGAVYWCLDHDKGKITSRGRIAPKPPERDDCSGKDWHKGINKLKPPESICPD